MDYRTLGQTDLQVTPVALGTWAIGGWLWGGTDDADAVAGIRRAVDLGMTTIDTAPVYGFGHSESVVGQAIRGRRDRVQVLTKFGLRWDLAKGAEYFQTEDPDGHPLKVYKYGGRDSIIDECEQSLKRLGIDAIDLYQHHWPDPSTPVEETMAACERLLKDGKIRAIGVSNYTPEMMETARQAAPLASNQPPFSMLRRDIQDDVLPWCRRHNVGVLVYSPLQGGILTGKVTLDRTFPPTDKRSHDPLYAPENRRRVLEFLEGLRPIAQAHDATLTQVVINWTIHQPGVTSALVGVRNPKQAEENAGAAAFRLTGDETRRIDRLLGELTLHS